MNKLIIVLMSLMFIGIASAQFTYTYSYPTSCTSFVCVLIWLNTTTGGLFWIGTLITLFIIAIFGMGNFNIIARVMVAGFICMLLSLFLTVMSTALVPIYLPFMFGLISTGSAAFWLFDS